MADLSAFPITQRWPARHPDRIQLYSFATPNGVKASIALEELGLAYEAHLVSITDGDQKTPEFLSLNPNGKIPAIIDPDGLDGRPLALWESGAILAYLAEKAGRLMPADPAGRLECLQWVFFQVGGVGPMFGQFGFFHKFAGKEIADRRPFERYRDESRRLLGVLDRQLATREWLLGDGYSIADIATFPWVRALKVFYGAEDILGMNELENLSRWLDRTLARPAVKKGLEIPARK
ncbi:MAG: glutathione S-transferase N-terminal domain-containing protein [Methylobacterium mesophilicum]|nr:glutathione S-transferase N-terminal domain-containing protein [Methylobacterium mesophilicum]